MRDAPHELIGVAQRRFLAGAAPDAVFAVVHVLARVPPQLDEATRSMLRERLFSVWLAEQRAAARIEWYWGAAEAADVPAVSL